jgi:hypothetical protein
VGLLLNHNQPPVKLNRSYSTSVVERRSIRRSETPFRKRRSENAVQKRRQKTPFRERRSAIRHAPVKPK